MRKYIAIIIIFIVFSSCAKNSVFSEYKSIPNSEWHKDSIVNFTFNATDTLSKNAIYVNLRNDKNYDFNNIFLIMGVDFPNNTKIVDTLEYKMTDEKGYYLGEGFTDIKENKLEFRINTQFPNKGKYNFYIQQAMRKNGKESGVLLLEGITDVGIQIEKIK